MRHVRSFLAASLVVAMLVASAHSRQLSGAPPGTSPTGPRLAAPPATPAGIPSQPQQRAPAAAPIQRQGPSRPKAIPVPARPDARPATPPVSPVRDLQGRPVPGAVPLSPTQALDPASGRTIQTLPSPPVPR